MKHLIFTLALLTAIPAHAQTVMQRQARADDRSGVVFQSMTTAFPVYNRSGRLPYWMAGPELYFTSSIRFKNGGVASQLKFTSSTTPFSHPSSNSGWLWRHMPLVDHTHDDCDYAKRDCGVAR